jgi:hypothetical protein
MKRQGNLMLTAITMLSLLAITAAPAWAQYGDIPPAPIPIPVDKLDLNGTWTFQTSEPTVTGDCPAGTALSGTAAITQEGMNVTLKYLTGPNCRPAAVCSYAGTLDEDNQFVVSNSVTVDGEGGKVTSEIHLTVFDNGLAKGTATNHYVHPKGFECQWKMFVSFMREDKDNE